MKSLDAYKKIIEECEAAVQEGRGGDVRKQLEKLNSSTVPDSLRLKMANLCRRVGLINVALRVLSPRIRNENSGAEVNSGDPELMEYAILLQRTGLVAESKKMLSQVDSDQHPKAHLYQAFGLFKVWEHRSAIWYLERYIALESAQYGQLIGNLNLALAFCISGRLNESLNLVESCAETAKEMGKHRIYANCLELKTHIYIIQHELKKALASLNEASKFIDKNLTFDRLYIEKWKSYFDSMETGSASPLDQFKSKAFALGAWEDVRESDLFIVRAGFGSGDLRKQLVFGTPFDGYRDRIDFILNQTESLPDKYLFGGNGKKIMDFSRGTVNDRVVLPVGKKPHVLLELLSRDLYRPVKVGEIFAEVYQGEYFSILSSPNRVHKLVSRTQKLIEELELPITIEQRNGCYRVLKDPSVSFLIPRHRPKVNGHDGFLHLLRIKFKKHEAFRSFQAMQCLGLKDTQTRCVLNHALESGDLIKIGRGAGSFYRFVA